MHNVQGSHENLFRLFLSCVRDLCVKVKDLGVKVKGLCETSQIQDMKFVVYIFLDAESHNFFSC